MLRHTQVEVNCGILVDVRVYSLCSVFAETTCWDRLGCSLVTTYRIGLGSRNTYIFSGRPS